MDVADGSIAGPHQRPLTGIGFFNGGNLTALGAASGQTARAPTCAGAIDATNDRDSLMARYGGPTYFACLMLYQGGNSLNTRPTFA